MVHNDNEWGITVAESSAPPTEDEKPVGSQGWCIQCSSFLIFYLGLQFEYQAPDVAISSEANQSEVGELDLATLMAQLQTTQIGTG